MPLAQSAPRQNLQGFGDAHIVALAQAGSEAAFREIMRRNNRRLFRVARAVVRDAGEAEDVLQEAYLKAFAGLASFRGEASLSTWLTRITLNDGAGVSARRSNSASWTAHQVQAPTFWSFRCLRPTILKRQPPARNFVACSSGQWTTFLQAFASCSSCVTSRR